MYCKWGFFTCGGPAWKSIGHLMGWRMEKVEMPCCLFLMALLSSLRSYGWSGELAGDRPNHQQSEGPLGSCARQCPQLQGLLHSWTRRRGANGGNLFSSTLIYPDCFHVQTLQPSIRGCCQLSQRLDELIVTLTRVLTFYWAGGGVRRHHHHHPEEPGSWHRLQCGCCSHLSRRGGHTADQDGKDKWVGEFRGSLVEPAFLEPCVYAFSESVK